MIVPRRLLPHWYDLAYSGYSTGRIHATHATRCTYKNTSVGSIPAHPVPRLVAYRTAYRIRVLNNVFRSCCSCCSSPRCRYPRHGHVFPSSRESLFSRLFSRCPLMSHPSRRLPPVHLRRGPRAIRWRSCWEIHHWPRPEVHGLHRRQGGHQLLRPQRYVFPPSIPRFGTFRRTESGMRAQRNSKCRQLARIEATLICDTGISE